ncbi:hypothetical protein LCGC14_1848050 [marine sediment metagenome]|uniref:Uncharacterized protein n=1 Tax=marine sediment metagenome TaxID=412755 RepID=A0A0F9GBB2_9ZZZZ
MLEIQIKVNGSYLEAIYGHEYDLRNEPESATEDISQRITDTLNRCADDTIIQILLIDGDTEATTSFRNGRRGWEARSSLETWLAASLTLAAESDCDHGPISSEQNRASTRKANRKHGRNY